MNEFMALRAKARERRDAEIAKAREDYESSLAKIAELEQRLLGKPDPQQVNMAAAVERVIPRDEPFTTDDVMRSLEALDPSRVWLKRSVARYIRCLREQGLLQRVRKATVKEPAAYIRSDVATEAQERSLRQTIVETVKRPMFIAEVLAAVLEAGYRTTMKREHFRTHCIRELRTAGFRESPEGRWLP